MPEQTTDVTANSDVNEILKQSPDALAEKEAKPEDSSPEEEQAESAEEASSEDVKPETEAKEADGAEEDGKPIPYPRFKEVNDEKNTLKTELDELKDAQSKFDAILEDPEVLRAIRKKQGLTDEAIDKELGVAPKTEAKPDRMAEIKALIGDADLSTTDGWLSALATVAEHFSNKSVAPIQKTLTESQKQEQVRTTNTRLEKEATEAAEVCKETFGIEYGDEKDAKDPNTGAGKILVYLNKYPEKVQLATEGRLSKTDLLRLAMSEEGVKILEKKGETKEKKRQTTLKKAAMEGEAETQGEDYPQADWPTEKIIAWKEKHPNA